jgi:hypothetical protein
LLERGLTKKVTKNEFKSTFGTGTSNGLILILLLKGLGLLVF